MSKCDFCDEPCGNSWCPAKKEKKKKEKKEEKNDSNDD